MKKNKPIINQKCNLIISRKCLRYDNFNKIKKMQPTIFKLKFNLKKKLCEFVKQEAKIIIF